MTKRALCVGVNKYPRPELELKGCVNDAKAWASLLAEHFDFAGSDVTLLTNAKATKKNVWRALQALVTQAKRGDVLVYSNSSHGTYRRDTDGDEHLYDEAICPYDCDEALLLDDELRELFDNLPAGVRLTVIADNCHSGSGTRVAPDLTPDRRRPRFADPRLLGLPAIDDVRRTAKPRNESRSESSMHELLLSGCRADQYSFDARIDGAFHGAMSHTAAQLIAAADYRITYAQLHRQLVPALRDANFDQEPQLEGKTAFKRRQVFT
ncbi:MAG: caspase family protein [Mycobacteriales bacterium]